MTEVSISPIVGWDTKALPAGYGALNIGFLPDLSALSLPPAEIDRLRRSLQLGIGAEQAEQLAKDLLELAVELRKRRKSSN